MGITAGPSAAYLVGQEGAMLKQRLEHYVDHGVSDMIKRLDNYPHCAGQRFEGRGRYRFLSQKCAPYLLPLLLNVMSAEEGIRWADTDF